MKLLDDYGSFTVQASSSDPDGSASASAAIVADLDIIDSMTIWIGKISLKNN